MVDLVGPTSFQITTCGTLIVKKITAPSPDPSNTAFSFVADAPPPVPFGGPSPQVAASGAPVPLTATSTPLPHGFNLHNGEMETMMVGAGSNYRVTETVPGGWQLSTASCDNGGTFDPNTGSINNIPVGAEVTTTCTFTDTLLFGAIKITKTAGPSPLSALE